MASDSDGTVYCICREPYDGLRFMIECDVCKDWFHGSCVGIQEHQASDIEIYHCPNCQVTAGPLVLKKRRNWHRHDYSEAVNGSKAVETGTVMFIRELKQRRFPSPDEVIIRRRNGHGLTAEFLEEEGFDYPIMVEHKDGLEANLPPSNISIQEIENHVGSMREIDVIDVAKQENYKMLMRQWTDYYNSPHRTKIFNVISLEFSGTSLAEVVSPPKLVRDLSWVCQFWPKNLPENMSEEEAKVHKKPEVQRYCLMGVKDSYTDFHVDFGGTSVWYHVLRGEKVFYLIRPTDANLALYERWLSSSNQSESFFGDQVDCCYKCTVRPGQTIFIPTGWIHAVLTPIDSLVFGGNFLHNLNISLQIKVYDLELRVNTPDKYLFPNFETLHWYAAEHIVDFLKACRESDTNPPHYLAKGAKAISVALKSWTHKKDYVVRHGIPDTIPYGKLLKDLQKEIKSLGKFFSQHEKAELKVTAKRVSKGKKKKGAKGKVAESEESADDFGSPVKSETKSPVLSNLARLKKEVDEKLAIRQGKKPLSVKIEEKPDLFSLDSKPPTSVKGEKMSSPRILDPFRSPPSAFGSRSPGLSPLSPTSKALFPSPPQPTNLKLKIPKNDSDFELRSPKREGGGFGEMRSPGSETPSSADISIYDFPDDEDGGGEGGRGKKSPRGSKGRTPGSPRGKGSKISGGKTPDSVMQSPPRKHLKLLSSPTHIAPPGSTSDSENENENHLVVDETPKKQRGFGIMSPPNWTDRSPTRPGANTQINCKSEADIASVLHEDRMSIPTIQGGLNGTISDILEASGYGTETEFKVDEEMGRASPSMRDAIQGMLSMSRMSSNNSMTASANHPLTADGRRKSTNNKLDINQGELLKRKYLYDEDTGDRMTAAYKDDTFVYPTLDMSDNEDEHIFKPRGRLKKDETWNPKAKLAPSCPKPEREPRPGVKKESVESQLGDAAMKMANKPKQKRQYIRKKPKPEKETPVYDPGLGTSSSLSIAFPSSSSSMFSPNQNKRPMEKSSSSGPSSSQKKPKKGMATAKQRLGKILKMNKMGLF